MQIKMIHITSKVLIAAALAAALAGSPPAALAATGPLCYVDLNALGGMNTGNSWTDAYLNPQSALTDSNCTEIWVAQGVYVPAPAGTRTVSFTIPSGVAVYGGFAGTETARSQRNWTTNVTILSGDIGGDDSNSDGNFIAETTADIQGSNSYHVLAMIGTVTPVTSSTVLDGFTITAGQANSTTGAPDDSGGGLYCMGSGAGGQCSPTLWNLVFSGNYAGNSGGGLYADGSSGISNPNLFKVTFTGNLADWAGGAVYNDGTLNGVSTPSLTDVTFVNNTATGAGGAMYNDGANGGIASANIVNVTFLLNNTGGSGGAIYNNGLVSMGASPTLANVTFFGNTALDGGAMYNMGIHGISNPLLTNVTFTANQALNSGGALLNTGAAGTASPTLTNVILWADIGIMAGNEIVNSMATTSLSYSVVAGNCITIPGNICGAGNLWTDPKLGSLGNYGGYTLTVPLWAGSSALDTGDITSCPSNDQRGASRPFGAGCDIGAFEKRPTPRADFDGDSISDLGYFHAASGLWGMLQSTTGSSYSSPMFFNWGTTGDIVTPGDFDGDMIWDPAFRTPPAGGQSAAYRILLSGSNYSYGLSLTVPAGWPGLGDTPVIGDYNGDRKSDPAVWRANTGVWIIPLSPLFNTYQFYAWGQSGDTPIGADVDGDLQTDIGYWRPSTGVWGFLLSSAGYSYGSPLFFGWGSPTDIPVMADYDGDLLADPAVVIPASGGQSRAYRILLSTLGYTPGTSLTVPAGWAGLGDTPVSADYDGDGAADPAIWRNNSGVWIIPKSSTKYASYMFAAWGASGDQVAR
jgi:predicted outer membrane repeat protein